jgi:NAD(P)-dependent dehydrogenase (short-subunit alcohol dehydrogenase family)
LLFAKELAVRLEQRGITNVWVNAVHPGVINTELGRHMQSTFMGRMAMNVFYGIGSLTGLIICKQKSPQTIHPP